MTTVFLLAAYGWAWLVWIPFVIIQKRSGGEFPLLVVAIGAYGPTIAAVIVTVWMDGAGGVRQLLRKYVIWRRAPRMVPGGSARPVDSGGRRDRDSFVARWTPGIA
jgi:hypothetical protein